MKKKHGALIFKYIIVSILALIMVFPFFWMISCALRPSNELLSSPPKLFPEHVTLYSFKHVLFETNIPLYFLNSVIISLTATVVCIIISLPAAYSFARHSYKLKGFFLIVIMICNMVPQASTLVPLYRTLNSLGLLNKKLTISFTHLLCMLPFSILMLMGFVKALPKGLEEAAIIDGCGRIQVLTRIILPISAPGIFSTAMYAFMISWEEFMYALTFATSDSARALSVGLQMFSMEYKVDWGSILASSVLMSLPILILFFFIQDQFIASATAGAIKE